MVENIFFLDSEQIRMGRMIPPKFAIPIEWEETSLNGGISPQSPQIISLQYQMIWEFLTSFGVIVLNKWCIFHWCKTF